jgi:putative redox protein
MATITIQLHQVGPSTSQATVRDHQFLVDRPIAKGGADLGPMGGEYFLSAVGGCFMSTLLAAIRARELKLSGIHTTVAGTLEENPTRFTSLELSVSGDGDDADQLEKLVEIADRGCIMTNTLRGHIQVKIQVAARV